MASPAAALGFDTLSWLNAVEGKWICIRGSFYNNYCTANQNEIACNSPIATNRQKWKISKVADDIMLLQNSRNQFYCDNQLVTIKCNSRHASDWNYFKVQYQGGNKFIMRGHTNRNYCVDEGSKVVCTWSPDEFGSKGWELFRVDPCHASINFLAIVPQTHMMAVIGSPYYYDHITRIVNPISFDTTLPDDKPKKKQCRECLPKSAKVGMTGNAYGDKITVGCCAINGSAGSHPSCQAEVVGSDWYAAKNKCEQAGMRLCTDEELEMGFMQYTECKGFPGLLHWTGTACYEPTAVGGDPQTSGNHCVDEPFMWTVLGEGMSGVNPPPSKKPPGWDGVFPKQPLECRPTMETASVSANSYGNEIGVVCCNIIGTMATRGTCQKARTWKQALEICTSQGLRLCTMMEIEDGAGRGPACNFDNFLQWTSTPCYNPTPCCGDPPGTYFHYDQMKQVAFVGVSSSNTLAYGVQAMYPQGIPPCGPGPTPCGKRD